MHDLAFCSIKTLHEKIARKEISKKEVVHYFTSRLKQFDPIYGAAIEVFSDESILAASNKDATGMLAGVPGFFKDNICQKNRIASCGSRILKNYNAPYDATVTARLKAEGSFILGRANCDEFAMGSSNETSAYGPVKNPWDTSRVPGGSSGGSAVSVAAGFAHYSLGSETGGSVRQPAAFCNLVGLKPTYGLISRYGLIAYASSLDQVSPFTRTVEDMAYVACALVGTDPHDATTLQIPKKNYVQALTGKIKPGLKIGVVDNALNADGLNEEMRAALEDALKEYEKMGAVIKRIQIPSIDYAAAVYFIVSRAEAASNLARFDGVKYGLRVPADSLQEMYTKTRYEGFGLEVRRRIMIGNYVLSVGHADAYYNNAVKVQKIMCAELEDAFKDVDVVYMPVTGGPAFKLGEFSTNSLELDLQDQFTAPANLTWLPALSVPCGFTKAGLPLGFQFMGPRLSEELLLQTAYAYEQVTQWHKRYPKMG